MQGESTPFLPLEFLFLFFSFGPYAPNFAVPLAFELLLLRPCCSISRCNREPREAAKNHNSRRPAKRGGGCQSL